MTIPSASAGGDHPERFQKVLDQWRASLVDLSGRNRLLNFRHTRAATLEITRPSAEALIEGLDRGWDFAPLPDEETTEEKESGRQPVKRASTADAKGILTQKSTAPALLRALGNLRRKSIQVFNDYGLWTLQLGIGMLNWKEDGAEAGNDAPLILLPVSLERTATGSIRLVRNEDEEAKINPALKVKLEQLYLDWSLVANTDPMDLPGVMEAASSCIEGKSGWTLSERVVLAQFASHKESMYQDLLENEALVMRSDLVQAVALGPGASLAADRFAFEEIGLELIDEKCPPEDSPLILDADASQRQAIAAVVAGESFVLDGPPGTGKSQTIANMIAGLMHAGRSVLFVSEKAAALDVVLARLRSVGLDSYALALHSHNTSRSAVAKELGRALEEEPRAPQLPGTTKSDAREMRQALTNYAIGMNEVREPFGQSLHDVLGRVEALWEAPIAYLSELTSADRFQVHDLTSQDLRAIIEATEALARVWDAVADPEFPWRKVRRESAHPRRLLEQARAALHEVADIVDLYQDLMPDAQPPTDEAGLKYLLGLTELLSSHVAAPAWWLSTPDFSDAVEATIENFLEDLKRVHFARAAAKKAAGNNWQDFSSKLKANISADEQALTSLSPHGFDLGNLDEAQALRLKEEFSRTADNLSDLQGKLVELADELGVPHPSDLKAAYNLCELVSITRSQNKPLAQWFSSAGVGAAEHIVVAVLADHLSSFISRRDRATRARNDALARAGRKWESLPSGLTPERPDVEDALTDLRPTGIDPGTLTRREIRALESLFNAAITTLEEIESVSVSIADRIGYPIPKTSAEARTLIDLVETSDGVDRALEAWFDPDVLVQVRTVVGDIAEASSHLSAIEERALAEFVPEAAESTQLPEAIDRLLQAPRGFGAYFSSQVRSDRRLIASISASGVWRKDLYESLPLLREWHAAKQALTELCRSNAGLLGRYVQNDRPDVQGLASALSHAEMIELLVPDALRDTRSRGLLANRLSDGCALDDGLASGCARLKKQLAAWQECLDDPALAAYTDELTGMSPTRIGHWLHAHLEPLAQGRTFLDSVVASIGRYGEAGEHTISSARDAVASAQIAQRELSEFAAAAAADQRLLGSMYQGLDTVFTSVDQPGSERRPERVCASSLIRRALKVVETRPGHRSTAERTELLGRFVQDGVPDTDALAEALDVARVATELAPDTFKDAVGRARLVNVLTGESVNVENLQGKADSLRSELTAWESYAYQPTLGSAGPVLLNGSVVKAEMWFRAHLGPLSEAAELIHSTARVVNGVGALTLRACRSAIAEVSAARDIESRFYGKSVEHRELLGELYKEIDTDRKEIAEAISWAHSVRRAANGGVSAPLTDAAARLMASTDPDLSIADRYGDWKRQRDRLVDCFEPDRQGSLHDELTANLADAQTVLAAMENDPYGPEAWTAYSNALGVLHTYRLQHLPSQLARRQVSAVDFPKAVERAVLVFWVDYQLDIDERLEPHRATDRNRLVERFRSLDHALVECANADVITACNARRPRRTTVGPAAILRREAQKQRRHMPVRRLLEETREVVRLVKPCFMMSPLTVSQFLPRDFRFDVVIFDEASQVLPQDAVNSIYRGRSLGVAGDPRQLPPTSFFSTSGDGDEDDEWDEESDQGFESILDASKASGVLRSLSLRWHYRSKHENLIAFSNHDFYENSMITFPGALETSPDVGVQFFKAEGVYDRGGRRDNPVEAAQVAERVVHHFTSRPHLTIGVVAFSKSQADAIEAAVEEARKKRPDLDKYFTEDRLDGFFIKNLETVQGDERDVIILSVGYGRDAGGRLRSEFGPINRDGGWRRLNVAVTRARRRLEVVASFHGSELPDSTNKSVQHLKRYLQYAEHGPNVLHTEPADPNALPESPFEQEVLGVLSEWGYSVQPQVGVAGFRIDMAVRHPAAPGSYAIGIECDGAMYHSSKAARDRDRLRESVLRDLGWKLHRIWGTDWYRNRRDATARLRAAVEAACAADPHANLDENSTAPNDDSILPPEMDPGSDVGAVEARKVEIVAVGECAPEWSRPYEHISSGELMNIRRAASHELNLYGIELQDPAAASVVGYIVLHVVESEGPIEEELIVTRVRSAWALSRSGRVVQQRVRAVLEILVKKNKIVRWDTAYDIPGRQLSTARTPTLECTRKVTQVPAIERQFVVARTVEEAPGIDRDDLLRSVARYFGWARLGADIRTALDQDIDALLARCELQETNGTLSSLNRK